MTRPPPAPLPIQPRNLKEGSLSFSQESLWFLQQLDPENIAYNSNYLLKLTGGIDRYSIERALNALVHRHAPLRTVYPNQGGSPVQVIIPFESFALPYVDFSGLPEGEQQQAIRRYISEQGDLPFDLQRGSLTRFALLHTDPNVNYFFFCTHHIGFDAWSRQIFLSELTQLYGAYRSGKEPVLPELPVQYIDYALWQKEWFCGEILEAYLEHWKNILSGDLPILELPTDRPRPLLQTFRGARFHFPLSQALSSQMKGFCQQERLTLFQLLLAAYALLLMRHTGQEDIIMGCPFANRPRPELDGLVGLFVNTLPIRVNLSGNPSVRELLKQVQSVLLDAFAWQAAPFEALVSEISPQRDLSRTPVFQAVINLRNIPKRQAIIEGLEIENIPRENAPRPFDISLEFETGEDGILDSSFQYNVDLYDEATISAMASHYQNLLCGLLTKPDRPIAELEILTPSELKQIVFDWNETGADFPQVCIHDLITAQAEKDSEAVAVASNDISMTYGDLEKKANQLAHYLRANGVRAEDRVGFYLPRSEKILISLLAILKAGGAYVPLDPTYPAERIAYMVENSHPAVIVTLSYLSKQLPDQFRKIYLDTESGSIDTCESRRPVSITDNNSLAYVIYTSGSTGRPKGAMNAHKGVVNYLSHLTRRFHLGASDRVVQFTSLSFDPSVWSILGTLSFGGTVFLLDDDQMRDPDLIYSAIIEYQATHINTVPTMLKAICESALAGGPKKNYLRLISAGGEVIREADLELLHRAFGESVKLNNHYGPTECSISCTHYLVPAALPNSLQVVPIGKPISNVRNYILDNNFHPVPQGVKGEMFIGGIGVGQGYWNRPDLTAERFLVDPFWSGGRMYRTGDIVRQLPDGTICFLGRSDDQVKIRGYRVELSEIETVVHEFPGVKDAAVVFWHQDGPETLVAYITLLEGQKEKIQADLREYLAARLPFYMLPSAIMVLKEMPITPSRKIDRRALPRPEAGAVTDRYLAPRNDIETRLVSIWKEILAVEQVGVRDNFFELGGHSLLAVRLMASIQEEFGQSLPLLLLFKDGTVEAIAESLTNTAKTSLHLGIEPVHPQGTAPPLFLIRPYSYMHDLVLALSPEQPVFGLVPVENGKMVYQKSVQETAKVYYRNLVDIFPQGPYLLLGHSAQGYFALELARLLIQSGQEVVFLGLLDTFHPYFKSTANLDDRINFHINNLRDENLRGILQYFGQGIQRLSNRLWSRVINAKMVKRNVPEDEKIREAMRNLVRTYEPEPFEGKVTIFAATERPWDIRGDPMEQWANTITGHVNIVPIPGDHITMLQPPHVVVLAEKIKALLPRRENG
jgi:amino acid adenylation domain-containing protein